YSTYLTLRAPLPFPTRRSSDLSRVSTPRISGEKVENLRTKRRESGRWPGRCRRPQKYLAIRPSAAPAAAVVRCWCLETHPPKCRSEEHTSELQSRFDLVCRLLL